MELWVVPSETIADRVLQAMAGHHPQQPLLGEPVLSLSHFLKQVTQPTQPILKRSMQRHWIQHLLQQAPLRYFHAIAHHPHLASLFTRTIMQLKQHGIGSTTL